MGPISNVAAQRVLYTNLIATVCSLYEANATFGQKLIERQAEASLAAVGEESELAKLDGSLGNRWNAPIPGPQPLAS
jgi:hypothetical protein